MILEKEKGGETKGLQKKHRRKRGVMTKKKEKKIQEQQKSTALLVFPWNQPPIISNSNSHIKASRMGCCFLPSQSIHLLLLGSFLLVPVEAAPLANPANPWCSLRRTRNDKSLSFTIARPGPSLLKLPVPCSQIFWNSTLYLF